MPLAFIGARIAPPERIGKNLAMPSSDPSGNGSDRDVLSSLPRTRPARRSAKRGARPAAGAERAATADTPTDTPARAGAKAAAAPKRTAAPSRQAPKRAAARTPRSRAAAAAPAARRTTAAPQAAEPVVPPAGYATPSSSSRRGPDPFAIAGTAVQAAGEIAQIGATLWAQALRSAMSRLPRP